MRSMDITIEVGGKVSIETKGFQGQECLAATAKLKAALGGNDFNDRLTAEAFVPVPATVKIGGKP